MPSVLFKPAMDSQAHNADVSNSSGVHAACFVIRLQLLMEPKKKI